MKVTRFFLFLATDERRKYSTIYQYKKTDFSLNLPSKKNLMVNKLFIKKAVPLHSETRNNNLKQ